MHIAPTARHHRELSPPSLANAALLRNNRPMTQSLIDHGAPEPCPAPFNLAAYVLATAEHSPEKTALEVLSAPGTIALRLSYGALAAKVRGTATGLAARGIKPGDRIALRLGNSPAFPIAFLAAITLGAIPVPTAAALTAPEFRKLASLIAPVAALVCDTPMDGIAPLTLSTADIAAMGQLPPHPFATTTGNDPAYMIFTSGSSGQPKAVMHAHRAVWARRMMWRDWYDLQETDRMLHAGAFNWTFTLGTGLMDPWARGATALVYAGPPDRHVWAALAREHAPSLFAAAPGVFRQIVEAGDAGPAFATLRHALCAGEALPDPVRAAWEAGTGRPVHEALGMSEVSTYVSASPNHPHRPGTTGRAQSGRRIAALGEDGQPVPLGEDGMLAVHRDDQGLMLGYLDGSGITLPLQGDWFLTGDRARFDADGYVTHCGRADDLMNAGGFRVAPQEVEATLARAPDAGDVAVCAVSPRDGVSIIVAFHTGPAQARDLHAFAKANLARYKQPREYRQVDALPRKGNGKLARKELPELWQNN